MATKKKTPGKKTAARSYAGKIARNNGAAFEDLITKVCGSYRARGIADIEKTPEPTKVIKTYGLNKFICCFTKQAQPDFKGVFVGGRMVVFEAKNIEEKRIALNRITTEQAECFTSYDKLGALCFVLISYQLNQFYAVPWKIWANFEHETGKKSINLQDLKKYEVKIEKFLEDLAFNTVHNSKYVRELEEKLKKILVKPGAIKIEPGEIAIDPGKPANFVEQNETEPDDYCTICDYGGTTETRQGTVKFCKACEPPRAVNGKVHRGQCPNFIRK